MKKNVPVAEQDSVTIVQTIFYLTNIALIMSTLKGFIFFEKEYQFTLKCFYFQDVDDETVNSAYRVISVL